MSAVKSRLKLFEQTSESEDMANVARGRPPLANKPPVTAKFPKAEDANANVTSKPAPKWGAAAPLNIKQDELNAIKNSLNKGSAAAPASDVNKSSHNGEADPAPFGKVALKPVDNRRVSVPKVFQTEDSSDLHKSTEPSDKVPPKFGQKVPIMPLKPKPETSEPVHPPVTPVKTWGQKNNAATPASSTPPAEAATPVTKTWGKPAVTSSGPTTVTASNTSTQSTPAASAAATSVARNWGAKPTQTSPAVKSWNTKTSSPAAVAPAAANPSPASPQPSNPPTDSSHEPEEENGKGKFDFRAGMKQRNSITSGLLTKPVEDQRSPMTEITPNKSPHVTPTHVFNYKMNSPKPGEVQLRSPPGTKPAATSEKKRQSSGTIIERKSDQKKFKKVKLSSLPPESDAPPSKPALPSNIDLTQVKVEYQKRIQDLQKESDLANAEESCDDIYDDGSSAPSQEVLPRRPTFKRNSERISMIPDIGPEEEGDFYDDGVSQPIADDIYADGETEKKEESFELIYEDEESMSPIPAAETEEDKKKRLKEEAEAKKREEKERKEREKQEKEQKKKEEKEKKEKLKLLKKFNLTGNEVPVGEGTIKQDAKGSGLNLTVKRGQVVTIVRMNDNPANKWLIKIDELTLGYVDSKNIDIDPSIIKQTMVNIRKNSRIPDDDDQPNYDDVPQDGNVIEDEGPEEIYEEL